MSTPSQAIQWLLVVGLVVFLAGPSAPIAMAGSLILNSDDMDDGGGMPNMDDDMPPPTPADLEPIAIAPLPPGLDIFPAEGPPLIPHSYFLAAKLTGIGSPATGSGSLTMNPDGTVVYFDIFVTGLIGGRVTGAHFHDPANGSIGPAVHYVNQAVLGHFFPGGPDVFRFSGSWTASDPALGSVANSGPLTPTLVTDLLAGKIFFDVHTSDGVLPNFPNGEVRGPIILQEAPEPSSLALFSVGAMLLGGATWVRRRQAAGKEQT
jgi:hypothetical protein